MDRKGFPFWYNLYFPYEKFLSQNDVLKYCMMFHFLIKFIILYVFLGVRLMILSDQIPPMLIKTTFFLLQFSLGILNYFTDVKWFSRQS